MKYLAFYFLPSYNLYDSYSTISRVMCQYRK
nr:MAG TPA: hypothetical protein [Caudoviricetes sp.]